MGRLKHIYHKVIVSDDPARLAFQFFSLFRYGILLLVAVTLARWFPDQELIADYERLLLLGSSVSFFWVGGLNDAFLVLFRKSPKYSQPGILARTRSYNLMASFGTAALTLALAPLIFPDRFDYPILLGFAVFLAGDNYSMQALYLWLAERRAAAIWTYTLTVYTVHALALLIPVWYWQSLEAGVLGLACMGMFKAIWAEIAAWTGRTGLGKKTGGKALWEIGAPLMGAALLSYSATYLDSFLVETYFPDQFANFRYGAKELPLVLLLANALSISQSGEVAEASKRKHLLPILKRLRSSSLRLMHLLFPVTLLLLCASRPLFHHVFGENFSPAVPIFDIYLLLVIPRMLFPQSVLRGLGQTRYMAMSAGIELALNVVLSLLGLWWWGMEGIAAATVVAFLVEKVILLEVLRRKGPFQMKAYTDIFWWGMYSAVLLGALAVKYLLF